MIKPSQTESDPSTKSAEDRTWGGNQVPDRENESAEIRQLEDQLRRTEENLAEIQRLTKTGSWVLYYATGQTEWTRETCRILGFPEPPPSPTYSQFRERVRAEDREPVDQALRECFESGEPKPLAYQYILPDGSTRHMQSLAQAMRDESGQTVKLVGTVMDVTELRLAEEELSRHAELLSGEKRILEMIANREPLSTILTSACHLVEKLRPGSLCSIQLLERTSKRLWNGASPSLPQSFVQAINGVTIGPNVGSCGRAAYLGEPVIVSQIRADPLWKNYRSIALENDLHSCWSIPVLSAQNIVLGTFAMYHREAKSPSLACQEVIKHIRHLVGIAIERQKGEEALRHSEALLAETQKLSQTGSFSWNVSTGKLRWSAESFHIYEYKAALTEPTIERVLERTHPEDRPIFQELIRQARSEAKDWEVEHRLLLPSGTIKHLHVRAKAGRDEFGNIEYVGALMDVTERKRADAELRQSQVNLANMTRLTAMGELAASIAHEVNQPLAAIVTNGNAALRWLEKVTPNLPEAVEAVQRIIRDGNRGSEVVARIRAHLRKDPVYKVRLNINEVIPEVITLAQAEWQGIHLQLELDPDLPEIVADRIQLQQILFNLTTNAIDALKEVEETEARSRLLKITTQRHERAAIRVTFQDSGSGIHPEKLPHLFEAFYTTKPEGLGLGLAISRSIVEGGGGRLWAESNEGIGATFHFTLPLQAPEGP